MTRGPLTADKKLNFLWRTQQLSFNDVVGSSST
jgi:hypothetical protein